MESKKKERPRLLIEEWLPIAEIGEESMRERRSMTALPPTYYLHVWWARRPLVASRAAVLASVLPAGADRRKFLRLLGIHGDPVATRLRIDDAKRTGEDLGLNIYGYGRAFKYVPSSDEVGWISSTSPYKEITVLDPTAGGGSIPFESLRLGSNTIANELNPVAWLILKATVEFPRKFGAELLQRFKILAGKFIILAEQRFKGVFPREPAGVTVDAYLWARTVTCPYCGGLVPLSPNWRLDKKGTGVRLLPQTSKDLKNRLCTFEIVPELKDQSQGTVKGGDGLCPYPDCERVIDGDEIKRQAKAGRMGEQIYTIVYKQKSKVGETKAGKPRYKNVRGFRAPRPEDNVTEQVKKMLAEKMPEWMARNIVPDEDIPSGLKTEEPRRYGMLRWVDLFAPRQIFGHCTGVEVFQELVEELKVQSGGKLTDLDKAAMVFLAISADKLLNYNCYFVRWIPQREVIAGKFDRHDFSFKWSFAEIAPTITGFGYDWAIEQTRKSLKEIIDLAGNQDDLPILGPSSAKGKVTIYHGSADTISLQDKSVDAVVMDPPYYDNVMYAELADFFYVWLKRTAGLLYPDAFTDHLSDKDREAVANPARFKGQKGAKALAGKDYQERMAAIFAECRRVLKDDGVMVVMFTHKASDAWDALASGLVRAGFVITASWPVCTEAEGSLHIKEKSAARSTIFLVCRPREAPAKIGEVTYWEDIEPKVAESVQRRVEEFQKVGIAGIDLYLACFGPALQVFSEHWPLQRGRPTTQTNGTKVLPEGWSPYAVYPEDALDAARREVKRWRFEQLATVKRQHHLDPLTEWYVLSWDAFKSPRFPADEALKLARVVGLDFDREVKHVLCEVKSEDVILWDSRTRKAKGKLGAVGEKVMIDTLHHAAVLVRDENTGAAETLIKEAGLLKDPTLLTALEALLNVLPPPSASIRGKGEDSALSGAAGDFEALEKLRKLAFSEDVPAPKVVQTEVTLDKNAEEEEEE